MTAITRPPDYASATFMLSVARLSQCPADRGAEVAFAGRSNAGKSSAINTLCGRNKLARTSNTPGRTQQINFFALDATRRLVDLPGYGFAKVPKELRKEWGALVEKYLEGRRSLAGVILLMDARHPLKPQDQALIEWVTGLGVALHILLTKSDKLTRGPAQAALLQVRKAIATLPNTSAQLFSSVDKTGLDEARAVLDRWYGGSEPPADSPG